MNNKPCYCDSGQSFSECCGPLISGAALATNPKSLMRSRYSAFCTGNIEYLIATLHSSKRNQTDRRNLAHTIEETNWMCLKVMSDQTNGSTGVVEFVAFYQKKGSVETGPSQLHERSRFVLEEGKWFYIDGEMLPAIRLGRNDICWCGSGKKVKKCHN